MALNKVMLIGNVGNDPEVRYLESNPQNPATNAKVASFRLATTERYRDRNGELREETTWHNVTAWAGRNIMDFKDIHKGAFVSLTGRLRNTRFTGSDGNERSLVEVVAGKLEPFQPAVSV